MSIQQNFPAISPSLSLNFARSKTLDPRITFTRTSSGTRTNETGLVEVVPANSPRFDHSYDHVSGTVRSLGLLVEESRTNLIRYSIISNVVGWSISGSTVTNNATTAPDGTNTAARIQATGDYVADLSISVTAGQTYTFSFWVKSVSGSGTWGINWFENITGHNRTTVNVTEEWERVSITFTPTQSQINVYVSDDRDNLATISDAYVWGAQLEQGSFKTSLIPTEGSTVTRTADKASITGSNFSNWFNNNEFSIFTHHKFPSVPPNYYPRVFDINTGNDAYRINHYHDPSIYGTKVGCSVVENNSAQYAQATSSYDIGDDLRMARCFKDNDFASYANGALIGSTDDTGVFTTTQRTVLYIGSTANAGSPLNGTISQLTYYPRRLSNDNLQNLTK